MMESPFLVGLLNARGIPLPAHLEEAVQSLYTSYDIPLPVCRVIPDEHIRLLLVQAVGYNLMMM